MEKIDIKLIEQIADLMTDKKLIHLEVEVEKDKTKISMSREGEQFMQMANQLNYQQDTASGIIGIADTQAEIFLDEIQTQNDAGLVVGKELTSPLVGVVYLSPSPGEAPFVCVGDMVKKGQQLCILEAMKVMNEFTAPRDGEIIEICIKDGAMVEYAQRMFILKQL